MASSASNLQIIRIISGLPRAWRGQGVRFRLFRSGEAFSSRRAASASHA